MAGYRLRIKRSAAKELDAFADRGDRRRIVDRIESLAGDPRPRGCEKLSTLEQYRVRQGRHRIIYSVDDQRMVLTIIKIGHRRDVYR